MFLYPEQDMNLACQSCSGLKKKDKIIYGKKIVLHSRRNGSRMALEGLNKGKLFLKEDLIH